MRPPSASVQAFHSGGRFKLRLKAYPSLSIESREPAGKPQGYLGENLAGRAALRQLRISSFASATFLERRDAGFVVRLGRDARISPIG
jgi:hypothetical protein